MRHEPTTEELFDSLDADARTEALRIAARLQAQGNDSAQVVAAAREAGIDDRFLRLAATQLQAKHSRPAPRMEFNVAAISAILFFFTQGYAGSVTYGDVSGANLWIPICFAAIFGACLPRNRNRWLAPLAVVATWIAVTVFFGVVSHLEGRAFPEMAYTYAYRIMIVEAALAFFGALIANEIQGHRTRRADMPSA